jgi:hypothetical protein
MQLENTSSRPWAQWLLGIPAVLVIGGIAAAMNWRYGQLLGHTEMDGYLFGALGVALVALNWILPGAAANAASRKARLQQVACLGLWAVCAGYTLVSSVGFSASHRAENGADRAMIADRYKEAQADKRRLTEELDAMKASPKYAASAGCADAKTEKLKGFCAEVKAKEASIREAGERMASGRPASADPQAETLSRITGFSSEQVSSWLAIAVAVVMELVSSLGFFAVAHAAPAPIAPTIKLEPVPGHAPAPGAKPMDLTEAARALARRPRKPRQPRLGRSLPKPSAAQEASWPSRRPDKVTT